MDRWFHFGYLENPLDLPITPRPTTLDPQLKIENNNNSWINVRSMLAHRLRLRLVHIGLYRLVATRLWGLQLYVQKVLCSEGPLFRRFYVQKVLCSEGSIFRRFYVQKVPCSERFVQKVLWLESTLAIKQYYLFNLSESVYIYNKKYVF